MKKERNFPDHIIKSKADKIKRMEGATLYIVIAEVTYPLGEISYKTFYQDDGYSMLKRIIIANDEPLLETIKIMDQYGNTYTIEEFFDEIKSIKIYI